jgi:protein-disulfide isomerase
MSFPHLRALFAGLFCLSALALPARAEQFTATQKSEIESIVHSYLLAHPEVLREVAAELEKKQQQEETDLHRHAIETNRNALFNSPFNAVVGNPDGKITLVEFFDYNCGYCKRALGDLLRLMKAEPELRVVLADFPVLGPDSVEAARVAAAVRKQISGAKFLEFHQKLLSSHGHVGKEQALAAAQEMGLDMARVEKDMTAASVHDGLAENMKVGDALGLNGTPSYVIGDEAIVGAVGFDELKARVDSMARCGKTSC